MPGYHELQPLTDRSFQRKDLGIIVRRSSFSLYFIIGRYLSRSADSDAVVQYGISGFVFNDL